MLCQATNHHIGLLSFPTRRSSDLRVYCLASGRDGSLWVGTKDGFSRLPPQDGEIQSFGTRDGLSQSTVYTFFEDREGSLDRKSTRLNSSHVSISYAVFCVRKKHHS